MSCAGKGTAGVAEFHSDGKGWGSWSTPFIDDDGKTSTSTEESPGIDLFPHGFPDKAGLKLEGVGPEWEQTVAHIKVPPV